MKVRYWSDYDIADVILTDRELAPGRTTVAAELGRYWRASQSEPEQPGPKAYVLLHFKGDELVELEVFDASRVLPQDLLDGAGDAGYGGSFKGLTQFRLRDWIGRLPRVLRRDHKRRNHTKRHLKRYR